MHATLRRRHRRSPRLPTSLRSPTPRLSRKPFEQNPVLPERSHYFDAGIVQKITPNLQVGIDAYYKIARDLLDDGQFGAALILNGFNYETAKNTGVELSATYKDGNFSAYGNLAWARQQAKNIVSNQFLFGLDELAYIANNYIYTDHAQTWTASAGASYLWQGTRFSADMVYGSGLRSGFANTEHVPPYATLNLGVSREFKVSPDLKPITARLDCRECLRHRLRDQGRFGNWRVRTTIRNAPRLLRWAVTKTINAESSVVVSLAKLSRK